MIASQRRHTRIALDALAGRLVGLPYDMARVLVEDAGGVLHRIDEPGVAGHFRDRVNVRVVDGIVVRVLSVG